MSPFCISGSQIVFGMPSNNFKSSSVRFPFSSLVFIIIAALFEPIFLIYINSSSDALLILIESAIMISDVKIYCVANSIVKQYNSAYVKWCTKCVVEKKFDKTIVKCKVERCYSMY
jgi:hypothetical protein